MKSVSLFFFILFCLKSFSQNKTPKDFPSHVTFTPKTSQKPVIDSTAVLDWPVMNTDAILNNDGTYFLYTINNRPRSSQTLVVQKTDNTWKKAFAGIPTAVFVPDNQVMYQQNDTLFFFSLASKSVKIIADISGYKQPKKGDGSWLAYQTKKTGKDLVLQNLLTATILKFRNVLDYSFDEKGKILLIKIAKEIGTQRFEELQFIDLKKEDRHIIWNASANQTIGEYALGPIRAQLTFIINDKDTGACSLWYYDEKSAKSVQIKPTGLAVVDSGLSFKYASPSFTEDGKYIFFDLHTTSFDTVKTPSDPIEVDVWSYKDSVLQSSQLLSVHNPVPELTMAFNIGTGKTVRLCQKDEGIAATKGGFALVTNKVSIKEHWWRSFVQKSSFLISLKDGIRHPLNIYTDGFIDFSPAGKFLIYFSASRGAYYSYNLKSRKLINISKSIPYSLALSNDSEIEDKDSLHLSMQPIGIAGWLPNDAALFVYDHYDIWRIDPSGQADAVNITNGYGRINQTKLSVVSAIPNMLSNTLPVFSTRKPLLLSAFNILTKNNGFFEKNISNTGDPRLLSMGSYHIYTAPTQTPFGMHFNYYPLRARNKEVWIVMRQTASEAPNYFITSNFKTYKQLTDLQPHKNYNWLTSTLLSFKQGDNTTSQGILYKPENFDSSKKYPIIFYYYEKFSQYRYQYWQPDFSSGSINIPWFVSRGYLVFTPDIHYALSKTGESVCNSVIAAAQQLSVIPWVDSAKMGIAGHSFGGYETNYLITHSKLFAAAITAAGISDAISAYGGLYDNFWGAGSRQNQYEFEQYRLFYTLWERPDVYINNSPVLNLNRVSTPVLIIHNKQDQMVPFYQSIEFFMGLRRLEKKAWLLQYDKGGHGVHGREAEDLTIRMTQFFDHYLKGISPPKWMTRGIPAKLKGIDSGLELDPDGFCGDSCNVCKAKNYAISK